ncbi:MAG TPA: hypothetical protein VME46_10210 [Acidimicrobiales bacterium]|nr:hypothetical protein [Acidimicrobiales bacterium]
MSALRTEYEFVLPRGYLDQHGTLHKSGLMRLATARDELEPLRDPTINSADDPRLTILVLARVVRRIGTLELVTAHEIENLFAADLAYLQDFYGVINFGTPADIEALLEAQDEMQRAEQAAARRASSRAERAAGEGQGAELGPGSGSNASAAPRPSPGNGDAEARPAVPTGRRAAIEEVPSTQR